jgi:hypothetical protein
VPGAKRDAGARRVAADFPGRMNRAKTRSSRAAPSTVAAAAASESSTAAWKTAHSIQIPSRRRKQGKTGRTDIAAAGAARRAAACAATGEASLRGDDGDRLWLKTRTRNDYFYQSQDTFSNF